MKVINNKIYEIKEGDSLNSISQKFDVNPTSILIANNISPKQIRKGFVLYIPD